MKTIKARAIERLVKDLCIRANLRLRSDVYAALRAAHARETGSRAREILKAILKNAQVARREDLAICQDTGLPCVFVELGQDVRIAGGFQGAINRGVEAGYKAASLRNSVIRDPLVRGASGYVPAVIHVDIVRGSRVKITVLPKGFGCENKTQLRMFIPTAKIEQVKRFIVDAVKAAGPDACPPYVVGVGIGGTADLAVLLAKKALLRKCAGRGSKLEQELLKEINCLNIGPMGLGGKTTALAVHIQTYPTHIAGLPVAVNISCHALRSASAVL